MIKFKPALDTLQTEIAGRERQGIKPIPVTRKTLYRQAPTVNTAKPVNTASVTHREPERVTHTVNSEPVTHKSVTHKLLSVTHKTETGTHKAEQTEKSKPVQKELQADKVQTFESHTAETSDKKKAAAERQRAFRAANKEKYQAANRERMAAKRTK